MSSDENMLSTGSIWLKNCDKKLFLRGAEKNAGKVRTRTVIREVVSVFLVERSSKEMAKMKVTTPMIPNVPRRAV